MFGGDGLEPQCREQNYGVRTSLLSPWRSPPVLGVQGLLQILHTVLCSHLLSEEKHPYIYHQQEGTQEELAGPVVMGQQ